MVLNQSTSYHLICQSNFVVSQSDRGRSTQNINRYSDSLSETIQSDYFSFHTHEIIIFDDDDISMIKWRYYFVANSVGLYMADDIHVFVVGDRYRSGVCSYDQSDSWCISDDISDFFVHPASDKHITWIEFGHFFDFFAMLDYDFFYLRNHGVYDIIFELLFFDSFFEIFDNDKFLIWYNTQAVSSELVIVNLFFDVVDGLECRCHGQKKENSDKI